MFSSKLREELTRLIGERRLGLEAAGDAFYVGEPSRAPVGVEEYLPGGES